MKFTNLCVLIQFLLYSVNSWHDLIRTFKGKHMKIEEVPFIVFVEDASNHFTCSGSLIHPGWVLTAAHCFELNTTRCYCYFGLTNAYDKFTTTKKRLAKRFIIHPKYLENSMKHDIALIELCKPITLSNSIRPIALPKNKFPQLAPQKCLAVGFGRHVHKDNLVHGSYFQVRQGEGPKGCSCLPEILLCGFPVESGDDTCIGDSGSPLICDDNQTFGVLHGGFNILACKNNSRIFECGDPDIVSTYAEVFNYVDWIKSYVPLDGVDIVQTTLPVPTLPAPKLPEIHVNHTKKPKVPCNDDSCKPKTSSCPSSMCSHMITMLLITVSFK